MGERRGVIRPRSQEVNEAKRIIQTLFGRRWWWVTLLVLVLMGVLARLGIWQLDRLEQRREYNRALEAALAAAPVDLTTDSLPAEPSSLKDKSVIATGTYDFDNQLVLTVQNWGGRAGVHLVTPLVLPGGDRAVLVDRGWIPERENNPAGRAKYNENGEIAVEGAAALSQTLPNGRSSVPEEPQTEWYRVDIAAIARQMPYELLPIYVLQAPEGNEQLPFRSEPEIDLSEGPHLSYALQWFIFSLGLGIAYVVYVRKSMKEGEPA